MVENDEIQNKLAIGLGTFSEDILRQKERSKKIPIQPEVASYLYRKYLEYYDEIDQEFRLKILNEEIDYAKYDFLDIFVGVDKSFAALYPQHMETKRLFAQWIKSKENFNLDNFSSKKNLNTKISFNSILKKSIKQRRADFVYSSKVFPGLISFSKVFLNDNHIYLAFDKGTKRNFFSLFIGLEKPKFCFDIASFFASAQSMYKYQTPEDLELALDKALELFDAILPHFEEIMTCSLSKLDRD